MNRLSIPRPSLHWLLVMALSIISPWSPIAQALDAPLAWSRSDPQPSLLEVPLAVAPAPAPDKRVGNADTPVAIAAAPATPFAAVIDSIAAELQLDAQLLHAMIHVESRYNVNALSNKGAVGLMQVLPSTGQRFGYTDLRHPHTNVRAGATYLKWLLNHFDHDLELAIAGYNAGEGAVKKYGRSIPPYPETQNYVLKVMARYRESTPSPATFQTHPARWKNTPLNGAASGQIVVAPLNRLIELLLSSPSQATGES